MFRIVLCAFLLLFLSPTLIAPATATTPKPANTFRTEVWESLALYGAGTTFCTAFSVRIDPPVYLTATHCGPDGFLDGHPVEVLAATGQVMAMRGGKARPMLMLGPRPRVFEDPIYLFGFGGPSKYPFMFPAYISAQSENLMLDESLTVYQMMLVSSGAIGGMSGGPIVNDQGRVISMVECTARYSPQEQGFGCSAAYDELSEMFRKATAR